MRKFRAGLYEDVIFQIFGGDQEYENRGSVRISAEEMVLDLPESDYLIHGRPCEHWFDGFNRHHGGNVVLAKWTWLDGTFVGTWFEDNYKFLFSFTLGEPKKKAV
jgi:hypothetical protein